MAKKYYGVKKGFKPGVYDTWSECKSQVDGYSGAEYKSFGTEDEAKEFIGLISLGFSPDHSTAYENDMKAVKDLKESLTEKEVDIYVDGSFQGGKYSYAFVVIRNGSVIHTDSGVGTNKEASSMQNVAGELAAAMRGMKWAKDNNCICRIYHDYEGIGMWPKKLWKAKNEFTKAYVEFYEKYKSSVIGFKHVYGHTGNKFNELADKLAGQAFGK